MDNVKQLVRLMDKHNLNREQFADRVGYSVWTIHAYFRNPGEKSYVKLSDRVLDYFKFKLESRGD